VRYGGNLLKRQASHPRLLQLRISWSIVQLFLTAQLIVLIASTLPSIAGNKAILNVLPQAATGMQLYKVKVERGKRRTADGRERTYTLYTPQAPTGLPAGPYPLAVLIHGFLMTGEQQSNNAQALAERGFVVLTPDVTKLLLGDENRMENVRDVVDHMRWLLDKSGPLNGTIDPTRVAIGGNSSGGAVILEVVLEAQKTHVPVAALVSLDGVLWDRSFDGIAKIQPVKFLSLRAIPSLCNEHARLLEHLADLKFPIDDVELVGAHHCDVENPTTIRCSCVCGTSSNKYRRIFTQLMYTWLHDTFDTPTFSQTAPSFTKLVRSLQSDNQAIAHLGEPVSAQTAISSAATTH
jgi:hypothetical protein